MRPTCIECVAKHVGSALVLLSETLHGYQNHLILAIGELEQAVQECETRHPKLSENIRQVRKDVTSTVPEILVAETGAEREEQLEKLQSELSGLRADVMAELLLAAKEGRDISPAPDV